MLAVEGAIAAKNAIGRGVTSCLTPRQLDAAGDQVGGMSNANLQLSTFDDASSSPWATDSMDLQGFCDDIV